LFRGNPPILPALFVLFAALSLPVSCFAVTGWGSGFFITSSGYIVTNNHVVAGTDKVEITDLHGKTYPAKVIRVDRTNDLAIIKAEGDFPPLAIARSSTVRKGDPVFALGFPQPDLQGVAVKLTEGSVSSLSGMRDEPHHFQISVPLQHGNSGGPLLNSDGVVVGVVVSKLAPRQIRNVSEIPEAVNYAVKSNYLFELIDTDPNIPGELRPPPAAKSKTKDERLADVVARTEPSVVLITVNFPDHENEAAEGPPRYERDAAAMLAYQKGYQAYQNKRWPEALFYLGRAGELGNVDAQFLLANMYEQGQGVAQSEVEAARWFRKAAELGQAKSQNNLGLMYARGIGVAQNDVEATKWFRKAAEQGHPSAQGSLGYSYDQGRGVAKDIAEAIRWYRKSAEQGNAKAQVNLGLHYLSGAGVVKDEAEAARWLRKSAEQGNADGQYNLATLYEQGRGVGKDEPEAVSWYRKAAAQGQVDARSALRRKGIE
jgi:TPR repeat protein